MAEVIGLIDGKLGAQEHHLEEKAKKGYFRGGEVPMISGLDSPIQLPFGGGGHFYAHDLVKHIKQSGRNYIIQGQQMAPLSGHTKPQSLDYWLRQFARDPDTKQADNSVIDALVATGLFRRANDLTCPDSGRKCKGVVLAD